MRCDEAREPPGGRTNRNLHRSHVHEQGDGKRRFRAQTFELRHGGVEVGGDHHRVRARIHLLARNRFSDRARVQRSGQRVAVVVVADRMRPLATGAQPDRSADQSRSDDADDVPDVHDVVLPRSGRSAAAPSR
jgi:hypothetical protein